MGSLADAFFAYVRAAANESLMDKQTVVAPGAGAGLCSVTIPSAGIYQVMATCRYGGTADVVDNMEIKLNGTTIPGARPIVLPVANGVPYPTTFTKRFVAGDVILVTSIAAGAGGSVYIAALNVVKVND